MDSTNAFDLFRKTRAKFPIPGRYRFALMLIWLLMATFHYWMPISGKCLSDVVGRFLSIDGSILGFSIASFGISQLLSSKDVLVIMCERQYDETGYSFYKYYLLIAFNIMFSIAIATCVLFAIYVALGFSSHAYSVVSEVIHPRLILKAWGIVKAVVFASCVTIQSFVFLKMMALIFNIFQISLTVGTTITSHAQSTPFDKTNN